MATPNKRVRIEIYKPTDGKDGQRLTGQRHIRPVERQRMRPWLIDHLDKNDIPGLVWKNRKEKQFRISWKHAANQGFSLEKDTNLFERWAIHTGRHCDSDHKRWKANFRCALNSLPDVMEMKNAGIKKGSNAFKVYRFLDDKDPKLLTCKSMSRKKREALQTPVEMTDESGTEEDDLTKAQNSERSDHNYADYVIGDATRTSSLPLLEEFNPPSGVDMLLQADSKERVRTEILQSQLDSNPMPRMLFASMVNKPGMSLLKQSDVSQSGSIVTGPAISTSNFTDSNMMMLQNISLPMLHQLGEASKRILDVRKGLNEPAASTQTFVYLCKWCEKVFEDKSKLFRHFIHAHEDELRMKHEADGESAIEGATGHDKEQLQQEIATLEKQVFGIDSHNMQGKDSEIVIEDGEIVDLAPINDLTDSTSYVDDQALDLTIKKEESIPFKQDQALDLTTKGSLQRKGKWMQKPPLKRKRQGLPEIDYTVKFGNYGIAGKPRTKRQMSLHERKKEEAKSQRKAADEEEAMESSRQRSREDFLHAEILMSLKSGKSAGSHPSSGDESGSSSGKGAESSSSRKRRLSKATRKSGKAKYPTMSRKRFKIAEKVKNPTLKPFRESIDDELPYQEKVRKYLTNLEVVIDDVARNREPDYTDDGCSYSEMTNEVVGDGEKLRFCNSMNLIRLDQLSDEPAGHSQKERNVSGNAGMVIVRKRCVVKKKLVPQKEDETFLMLLKLVEESVKKVPYECCVCSVVLPTDASLVRHVRTHVGVSFFKCGFCGKTYSDDITFEKHVGSHNVKSSVVLCEICDVLMSTEEYTFHERTEHKEKLNQKTIEEDKKEKATVQSHAGGTNDDTGYEIDGNVNKESITSSVSVEPVSDDQVKCEEGDEQETNKEGTELVGNVGKSGKQLLIMNETAAGDRNLPNGLTYGGNGVDNSVDVSPDQDVKLESDATQDSQSLPQQNVITGQIEMDGSRPEETDSDSNTKNSGISVPVCFAGMLITEDCYICGESVSKVNFQQHKQDHYSNDYCYICHSPQFNLQDHHCRSHRNIRAYVCNMCDSPFYSRFHLTDHVVIHLRPRPDMTGHISCEQVKEFVKHSDGQVFDSKTNVPFVQQPPECFAGTLEHTKNVVRKGKARLSKPRKVAKKKNSLDPAQTVDNTDVLITESQSTISSTTDPSLKCEDQIPSNLFMDKKSGTMMTLQVVPGSSKSNVVLLQPHSSTWKPGSGVPSVEDLGKMIWVPVIPPTQASGTSLLTSDVTSTKLNTTGIVEAKPKSGDKKPLDFPDTENYSGLILNDSTQANVTGLLGPTSASSGLTSLRFGPETVTPIRLAISPQSIKRDPGTGSSIESTTTTRTCSIPSAASAFTINKSANVTGARLAPTLVHAPGTIPSPSVSSTSELMTTIPVAVATSVPFSSSTAVPPSATTMLTSAPLLLQSIQQYLQDTGVIPSGAPATSMNIANYSPINPASTCVSESSPTAGLIPGTTTKTGSLRIPSSAPSANTMLTSAPLLLQSIQKYLQDSGVLPVAVQAATPVNTMNLKSSCLSSSLPSNLLLSQTATTAEISSTCMGSSTSAVDSTTSTPISSIGAASTVGGLNIKLPVSLVAGRQSIFPNSSESTFPKQSELHRDQPVQVPAVVTMPLPHQTYQTVSHLLNQPVKLSHQPRSAIANILPRFPSTTTAPGCRNESPKFITRAGSFTQPLSKMVATLTSGPTPLTLPPAASKPVSVVPLSSGSQQSVLVLPTPPALNTTLSQSTTVLPTAVTLATILPQAATAVPTSITLNTTLQQSITALSTPATLNTVLPQSTIIGFGKTDVDPTSVLPKPIMLTRAVPRSSEVDTIPQHSQEPVPQNLPLQNVSLPITPDSAQRLQEFISMPTMETFSKIPNWAQHLAMNKVGVASEASTSGSFPVLPSLSSNSNSQHQVAPFVSSISEGQDNVAGTMRPVNIALKQTAVGHNSAGNAAVMNIGPTGNVAPVGSTVLPNSTKIVPLASAYIPNSNLGRLPVGPTQMTTGQPICSTWVHTKTSPQVVGMPQILAHAPKATSQIPQTPVVPVTIAQLPMRATQIPKGATQIPAVASIVAPVMTSQTMSSGNSTFVASLPLQSQGNTVASNLLNAVHKLQDVILVAIPQPRLGTSLPTSGCNVDFQKQSSVPQQSSVPGVIASTKKLLVPASQTGAAVTVAVTEAGNTQQKSSVESHSNIQPSTVTALLSKLMKSQPVSVCQSEKSSTSDVLSVPGQFVLTNASSSADGVPVYNIQAPSLNLTFKIASPSTTTDTVVNVPSVITCSGATSATVTVGKNSSQKTDEAKACKSIIYCRTCGKYFPSGESDMHNCVFPKTFKCPYCKLFVHINTFERHIEMHEKPLHPFVCLKCKGRFTHESDIVKHILNHFPSEEEKKPLVRFCRRCNKKLGKNLEIYLKHCQDVHWEKICRVCLKVFCTDKTTEEVDKAHIKTHYVYNTSDSLEHICHKCMKVFASKEVLDQHTCEPVFLACLSDKCEFTCAMCHQHYASQDLLDQHICVSCIFEKFEDSPVEYEDETPTNERCPSSSLEISPFDDLKHDMMDSPQVSVTSVCKNEPDMLTTSKIVRKQSTGLQSSVTTGFRCRVCQLWFHSQYQLKLHKLTSHVFRRSSHKQYKGKRERVSNNLSLGGMGSQLQQTVRPGTKVPCSVKRRLECEYCDKSYMAQSKMRLHKRKEHPQEVMENAARSGCSGQGQIPETGDSQPLSSTDHSLAILKVIKSEEQSSAHLLSRPGIDATSQSLLSESQFAVLPKSEEEGMIPVSPGDAGARLATGQIGRLMVIPEASAVVLKTETLDSEEQAGGSDSNKCGFPSKTEGIVATKGYVDITSSTDKAAEDDEMSTLTIAEEGIFHPSRLNPKRKKGKKLKSCPQFVTLKGRVQERLREAIKPHTLVIDKSALKKKLSIDKGKNTDSDVNIKQCRICDQNLSGMNEREVNEHMKEHRDPVSCSVCNGTFDKVSTLKEHLLQKHGSKLYTCVDCGTAHLGRLQLDCHRYKIHGLVNRAQQQSKHRELVEQKEKLKKKKIYGCRICKKSFFKLMKLTKHVWEHDQLGDKSVATETKNPDETECETSQNNMLEMSGQRSRSQSGESVNDATEKVSGEIVGDGNFMCSLCKIAFLESTDLFQHAKVHLDLKEISGKILNRNKYAQSVTGDPSKFPASKLDKNEQDDLEKSREYWTKAGRPRPVFPRLFQAEICDTRETVQSVTGDPSKFPASRGKLDKNGQDVTAEICDTRETADVCVCDICQKCIHVEDGSDVSTSVLNHKCY